MERNQRRQTRPGREHRPEGSRRPYSDDQETYRNPRNEYRDDDRGDDFELTPTRGGEYRDRECWPRDDRHRPEPRSQNWPHSRTRGQDENERPSSNGRSRKESQPSSRSSGKQN